MNNRFLFPPSVQIPRMPKETLEKKIVGGDSIFKNGLISTIYQAMDTSKFAQQYINFALWLPEFTISTISLANAWKQNIRLSSDVAALYDHEENRMLIIWTVSPPIKVILHEFWHAFVHILYKGNYKTLDNCTLIERSSHLACYPFFYHTAANLPSYYHHVSSVYAEIAEIMAEMRAEPGPQIFRKHNLSWPLSKELQEFLRNGLGRYRGGKFSPTTLCDGIANPGSRKACLIISSLDSILINGEFYASYYEMGHRIDLNITNSSLLKQLPDAMGYIFQALQAKIGNLTITIPDKELVREILSSLNSTEVEMLEQDSIIDIFRCIRGIIIEGDAVIMELFPLLANLSSHQALMDVHIKEVRKVVKCNPHWAREFQIKPATALQSVPVAPSPLYTGLTSTALGMALPVVTSTVQRNVSESTYNKLDLYCGKAMKLAGHCMAASYFIGTPFVGVATFAAGEGLSYLSTRAGISPTIPNIMNNAYSMSGVFYSAYKDVTTFVISVGGGVSGQATTLGAQYLYDKWRGAHVQERQEGREPRPDQHAAELVGSRHRHAGKVGGSRGGRGDT